MLSPYSSAVVNLVDHPMALIPLNRCPKSSRLCWNPRSSCHLSVFLCPQKTRRSTRKTQNQYREQGSEPVRD